MNRKIKGEESKQKRNKKKMAWDQRKEGEGNEEKRRN